MERLDFSANPDASATARRWLRGVLQRRGVADPDGALALMLSEVVTNAVKHAGTRGSITFERRGAQARLSVRDTGPGVPVVRHEPAKTGGGWGLRFVAALADRWGVDLADDAKTVWFELDVFDGHHHPAVADGTEG